MQTFITKYYGISYLSLLASTDAHNVAIIAYICTILIVVYFADGVQSLTTMLWKY